MKITTGKIDMPQRVVIYGPEGIGKSTFAAQFPKPLFIDIERGTARLDVSRVEPPSSWTMLMGIMTDLRRDRHGFETLVLDTADAAEHLCRHHVCAINQRDSIEDFPYGGGFIKLMEEWTRFLDAARELNEVGMHIVVLAHAWIKKREQPQEFGVYDKWEIKLSRNVAPATKEWADMVLFANYETLVITDDKTKSTKAMGGERVIHTEPHACWEAKSRGDLPARLPFPKEGAFAQIAHCFPKIAPQTAPQPPRSAPAQPAATVTTTEDEAAFNTPLYDLMERDRITAQEVQAAVAARGYFPIDTPIDNYPNDFVMGCLVAAWDKVKESIIANRKA